MRGLWQRSSPSAAVLVVLGVMGLAQFLPTLSLAATTCVAPIPLVAPMGIHLDLLTESVACQEHSYLPGANFGPVAQFFVLLSTSTIVVGLVSLLLALGLGLWLRRTMAAARDWLRTRLSPSRPPALFGSVWRDVTSSLAVVHAGIGRYQPLQRRGPPVSVL